MNNRSLKRLPAGWHVLHVGAIDQNYVSVEDGAIESVGHPGTLQLLVRDKDLVKMNVRLIRGCELKGALLDGDKKPKANLSIYLNNDKPQLSRLVRRRKAVSDEKGHFSLKGIPVGPSYYCLISFPDDGGTTAPTLDTLSQGAPTMMLRTITGRYPSNTPPASRPPARSPSGTSCLRIGHRRRAAPASPNTRKWDFSVTATPVARPNASNCCSGSPSTSASSNAAAAAS